MPYKNYIACCLIFLNSGYLEIASYRRAPKSHISLDNCLCCFKFETLAGKDNVAASSYSVDFELDALITRIIPYIVQM